jgi:hypothetical protein
LVAAAGWWVRWWWWSSGERAHPAERRGSNTNVLRELNLGLVRAGEVRVDLLDNVRREHPSPRRVRRGDLGFELVGFLEKRRDFLRRDDGWWVVTSVAVSGWRVHG